MEYAQHLLNPINEGVQCDVCVTWLHTICISVSQSMSTRTSNVLTIPGAAIAVSRKHCLFSVCPVQTCFSTTRPSTMIPPLLTPLLLRTVQITNPLSSHTKCRSISHKLDHLQLRAAAMNPLIICVCETWLDDSISDDEIYIPGFSLIRRNRDRHGGSIAMYIQLHPLQCETDTPQHRGDAS